MSGSHIGLYYPFLRFRNEKWLRISLLYWDEMRRIVPSYMQGTNTPFVDALCTKGGINGGGFIQPADPDMLLDSTHVSDTFMDFVERNRASLKQSFSLQNLEKWKPVPREWLDPDGGLDTPKLARVYIGKISSNLVEYLIREGLGVRGDGLSVLLHPQLAHVYLCELAAEMAKNRYHLNKSRQPFHAPRALA
jgi:hypothetical protein